MFLGFDYSFAVLTSCHSFQFSCLAGGKGTLRGQVAATHCGKILILINRLIKPAFKIEGFIVAHQDWVIRRLAAKVCLDKPPSGVRRRFGDHLSEIGLVHSLTTGGSNKDAAL